MPWYKRTIESGGLLEVKHYFATRDGRAIGRGPNREETRETVAGANQRHAEMDLARLIACNFGGEMGGASYVFTSREEVTEAEAMKRERNLLDRIKRARARAGLEPLRYIAVTEKQGKWHHHIVMQDDLSLSTLQEIWEQGPGRAVYAKAVPSDPEGYFEMGRYLLRPEKPKRGESEKPARRKYQRRWHASKGLKRPKVTKVEVKRPPRMSVPKAPKGYTLLPGWRVGADLMGNLYVSYACARIDVVGKGASAASDRPKGVRGEAPAGRRAEPSKVK